MTIKKWATGEALTATDLNDTIYSRGQSNLLYNGAMQVAQRSTSVAGITGSGYYTADRWKIAGAFGTFTQSIENDAPTGSGFRKSLKMICTTAKASPAAGEVILLDQNLEGQDLQSIRKGTSSAQQLTLSFWVKSNVTGTFIVELYDNNNARGVSASYSISASATWERKTLTFPADTTGEFTNDNGSSLTVRQWLGAGSTYTTGTLQTTWASPVSANRAAGVSNLAAATNNYWQITGVQLEVGPIASPFQFKPYGQELRECQRYYEKSDGSQGSMVFWSGNTINGAAYYTVKGFQVQKRAAPTMTLTSIGQTSFPADTTASEIDRMGFRHSRTANATSALDAYYINSWVAEAEL